MEFQSNENHNNKRVVRSFMELNDLKCVLKQMGYHLNCIYLFTHAWLTKLVFWVTPIGLVLSLIP